LTDRAKVLYVVQSFGGGVFSVLRDVAKCLVEDHDVDLTLAHSVVEDTPKDYTSQLDSRIKLVPFALPSRRLRPREIAATIPAVFRLVRLLRTESPDVVHLHSSVAGLVGRTASSIVAGSVPHRLYYTPHGLASLRVHDSKLKRFIYSAAESFGHALAGEVIACSRSEQQEYASSVMQGGTRNSRYIANGVMPPALSSSGRTYLSRNRLTVTSLGRLTEQKNPLSFARLAVACPDLHFVWIGDGEENYRLRLEDQGVEVTGWLPKEAVHDKLFDSDIYVHFSRWEGLSIALVEAMMAGLPIVASDISANRDAIEDGVSGLLASTEDGLSAAVKRLADSPRLRELLGSRARDCAHANFSIERMAQELATLYRER
jgi:glycosyltransferase involved in cell wall biosynthesis